MRVKYRVPRESFVWHLSAFNNFATHAGSLPDALSEQSIPLEARIVTLADVFDALMSKRAYKRAWSISEVMDYIESNNGSMFNPQCVKALKQNLDYFLSIRKQYNDDIQPQAMTA